MTLSTRGPAGLACSQVINALTKRLSAHRHVGLAGLQTINALTKRLSAHRHVGLACPQVVNALACVEKYIGVAVGVEVVQLTRALP